MAGRSGSVTVVGYVSEFTGEPVMFEKPLGHKAGKVAVVNNRDREFEQYILCTFTDRTEAEKDLDEWFGFPGAK